MAGRDLSQSVNVRGIDLIEENFSCDRENIDWQKVRSFFPALKELTYLNTAGGCAMSSWSAEEGKRYYDESVEQGDLCWTRWLQEVEETRVLVADVLHCEAKEIAFVQNASAAMNYAASIFSADGGVLLVENDFPSVTLPWLRAEHPVTFCRSRDKSGTITLHDLERDLTENTKSIALGHVNYSTGFRFDLKELSSFCKERGLRCIVDATQSFGAHPIDLEQTPLDCLLFSGYKWSTAGYGIGVLYLPSCIFESAQLPAVGWRSARIPYKMLSEELDLAQETTALDLGHPSFPSVFALGGAIRLIRTLGIENIHNRILELNSYLQERLTDTEVRLCSSSNISDMSGISLLDFSDVEGVSAALLERGIVTSVRNGKLRVSVHFYNNHGDVDRFVSVLQEIIT